MKQHKGSEVQIKFWGVRGSTPCANKEFMKFGGNTTCVQIVLPNTDDLLILDSGTGIRNLGNELIKEDDTKKGHLFLTHPHWDHLQGFPFFKPIYRDGTTMTVHLPMQPNATCRDILSGQMTETYFPVTPDMLTAEIHYRSQPSKRETYDGFSVEYMLANHHTNTAMYKFYVEEQTIIFAPDNELEPKKYRTDDDFYRSFSDFIREADLLIHDAQYNREYYERRRNWGHSTWEDLVNIAADANVKNLILTHHDPDSTDSYLSELEDHIQHNFSGIFESIGLARESHDFCL